MNFDVKNIAHSNKASLIAFIKLKKLTSLQQCARAILIATNRKQQKSIWRKEKK